MRQEIEKLESKVQLDRSHSSRRRSIAALLSAALIDLQETQDSQLKGYGVLSPEARKCSTVPSPACPRFCRKCSRLPKRIRDISVAPSRDAKLIRIARQPPQPRETLHQLRKQETHSSAARMVISGSIMWR